MLHLYILWQKNKRNYENTKIEKHENIEDSSQQDLTTSTSRVATGNELVVAVHGLFRGFVLSWFRDKRSFSFPVYPGWVLYKSNGIGRRHHVPCNRQGNAAD